MSLTISVTDSDHEASLRYAREQSNADLLSASVLNAPDFSDIVLWADRVWDEIEATIRHSFRSAKDAAEETFRSSIQKLNEAGEVLASRIGEVKELVFERLNAYVQKMIECVQAPHAADSGWLCFAHFSQHPSLSKRQHWWIA